MKIETFNEYQEKTSETAQYPEGENGITYLILGLGGEVGEILNKLKKVLRGDYEFTDEFKKTVAYEMGDVMWYIAQITLRYRQKLKNFSKIDDLYEFQSKHFSLFKPEYLYKNSAILYRSSSDLVEMYFFGRMNPTTLSNVIVSMISVMGLMASQLGFSMEEILNNNYDKLSARKDAGTIKGVGDGVVDGRTAKAIVHKKKRKKRSKNKTAKK